MEIAAARQWCAIVALFFVSSCSSPGSNAALPSGSTAAQPIGSGVADSIGPLSEGNDSCKQLPGGWRFGGSCVQKDVNPSGDIYSLDVYKGIKATMILPTNNAGKNDLFVVAEGTSDKDITGTYAGKKFPVFGSLPCYESSTGKRIACYGKPLVYVLFYNKSDASVTFDNKTGLRFNISAAKFPGKVCQIAGLDGVKAWYEYQVYGTVKDGKSTYDFDPQGALVFNPNVFELFAFSCK